ncbi:restriction endonuclease subunit S [Leeuwenhoekiella sp. MAR_2009_132]|uniref:restriction endonuclease subunit S n=1 Tax=Leeuwenhoekiella sp. MAR_2009_132 TaxID=1392489 RepID=UPI00055FCA40|nr:restriction endonuclease subunit S [Leeuwenhoekiella sp. MAR_2009_132]
MPENWKTYKLSEAFEIIGGGTPKTKIKEYWNGNIPWLSVVDFNDDQRTVFSTEKSITELGLKKSSTKILSEGQLIISARGTVGQIAQLGRDMAFNQSCYGLSGKENILLNDFGYYLIKSSITNIQANSHGSVFDTITRNTFDNIEVGIPPLPEQKSIASILSALDDKIELNLQMNKTLEQMAMVLYKHWFVDFGPFQDGEFVYSELGEIPKGWEVKKLGDVAEVGSSKRIFRNEYVENGIPFFRGKEVIQLSQGKSISTELFIKADKYHLIKEKFGVPKKDDILISSVGTIGVSWLVENNNPFYFKDGNLTWIKNYKPEVNGHFISQWLKSPSTQDQIKGETIGSTQQALTISALRTLKIALPKDESYVEDISKKLKLWNTALVANKKEIELLTQLRDTLLPKVISGEVRVKDAEQIVTEVL